MGIVGVRREVIVFRIQLVAVIYTNMWLLLEYVVYVKQEVIGLCLIFQLRLWDSVIYSLQFTQYVVAIGLCSLGKHDVVIGLCLILQIRFYVNL